LIRSYYLHDRSALIFFITLRVLKSDTKIRKKRVFYLFINIYIKGVVFMKGNLIIMTKITISFLIGVAVYLAIIGVVCLVKYLIARKQYKEDTKEKVIEVIDNEEEK